MTESFLGDPVIVAETSNETLITYNTPANVKPELFGLASFDSTYVRVSDTIFEMRYVNEVNEGIVVRFTRDGVNFVHAQVTKGNATVRWDAEVATVTIRISKGTTTYNVFNYRVTISREESQGSTFFLYTASVLIPRTIRTTYIVQMEPQAQPNATLFRVQGKEEASFFLIYKMVDNLQYAMDFFLVTDPAKPFLKAKFFSCFIDGGGRGTGFPTEKKVSDFYVSEVGATGNASCTFNITSGANVGYYQLNINSDEQDCTQISFPSGKYYEQVELFPFRGTQSFSSTPVANPVPPYLFIDAELTHDRKNISVFRVRAASSTWACEWTNYALPFVSVLLPGEGCTFADRVDALAQTGLPISKNLAGEYVLLRLSLSGILGVAPFCSFSVDLLRQRYWLPFREALAASEFKAALAFFVDPQYNLVGYERFFKW